MPGLSVVGGIGKVTICDTPVDSSFVVALDVAPAFVPCRRENFRADFGIIGGVGINDSSGRLVGGVGMELVEVIGGAATNDLAVIGGFGINKLRGLVMIGGVETNTSRDLLAIGDFETNELRDLVVIGGVATNASLTTGGF